MSVPILTTLAVVLSLSALGALIALSLWTGDKLQAWADARALRKGQQR